jgi:hypothetical protein
LCSNELGDAESQWLTVWLTIFGLLPKLFQYSGGFFRYCLTAGIFAKVGWTTHEHKTALPSIALSEVAGIWLRPARAIMQSRGVNRCQELKN